MISRLLTIVIPTRNRLDLVGLCLRSVFERQKVVPPVIVSDNSTSQLEGLRLLQKRYGFSYVRQSGRLSMTDHHNTCLNLPHTPWALLLHDDDELYPDALEELEMFLGDCGDVGIVVGGFQRMDERSVAQATWIPKTMHKVWGENALVQLGLDFKAHPPSTVYNVASFREVGGFPDALGVSADYPLILRLTYTYGVAFFPHVLGCYRVGPQQGTDFSLDGAERTLNCTIRMSNLTRAIGCSAQIADQLVDYNTWWIFRIIAGNWFSTHPFFISRLFGKCLRSTPANGHWKNRLKQEYPLLFFRPRWLAIFLYKTATSLLPVRLRRRLRAYCWAWLRASS